MLKTGAGEGGRWGGKEDGREKEEEKREGGKTGLVHLLFVHLRARKPGVELLDFQGGQVQAAGSKYCKTYAAFPSWLL